MRKKRREKKGVDLRWMAMKNCNATTANVRYFVKGSWPQSFVTFILKSFLNRMIPLGGLFGLIVDEFDEALLGLPTH